MSEGFQQGKSNNPLRERQESGKGNKKRKDDEDLIIEENTIYEIDRECYERLKRLKKRKIQLK